MPETERELILRRLRAYSGVIELPYQPVAHKDRRVGVPERRQRSTHFPTERRFGIADRRVRSKYVQYLQQRSILS
jgi:hypothetical protein